MRKLTTMTALICCALAISACGNRSSKRTTPESQEIKIASTAHTDEINIQDSLHKVHNGVLITEDKYEGTLPAADGPGIQYSLTLIHYDKSDNGVYRLKTVYIDAPKNVQDTFTSQGRYATAKGSGDDKKAEVIHLTPFSESEVTTSFVKEKDSNLTLLGKDLKKPASKHNYTLVKVIEKK